MNERGESAIAVLHVDDEPDFADMVRTFLEREDERISVETATSASNGLDRLSETEFDCVVSDYEMPGQNGIEFLEAVREEFPALPFILYTGKGSEEVASEAIAAGVTDYLQKQIGTEQYELLANRIRNVVEQYRANRRTTELERIRGLVADINKALVRSSTRAEIESSVCEVIADIDSYCFAWIGEPNLDAQSVDVRAAAGVEQNYLDTVEITTDDNPTGQGPVGQAVQTREMAVLQNITEADEYEPWREEALERGYQSSAALPLVYDDTLYGVLNVYAGRTEAFDDEERDVLTELAGDIALALHHQEIQRNLQNERDRFQHLVDGIEHYAIFMMDTDGHVSTWNAGAEQIKGYTADEIIGTHYEAFFPDDAVEQGTPRQLLGRAADEGAVSGRGWRVRNGGERFWADFTLTALYDGSSDIRGYAKVTQDMTDQRRHEQQLKRQNERLEDFASIVSHDLRNPLTVAAGKIELAREECDSDHLDDVDKAVERSLTLVDDLLELAREGEQASEMEPLSLAETVTWCWQNIETANATLVVETEQTVRAVPTRLKQLLDNLLANAVEHGGEGVTVTVGDLENGFYVSDNGAGIPVEERERVFDNGYSTADGTGLGLDIVQDCVDAHGWSICVTDCEPGGARFEITGVECTDN